LFTKAKQYFINKIAKLEKCFVLSNESTIYVLEIFEQFKLQKW